MCICMHALIHKFVSSLTVNPNILHTLLVGNGGSNFANFSGFTQMTSSSSVQQPPSLFQNTGTRYAINTLIHCRYVGILYIIINTVLYR